VGKILSVGRIASQLREARTELARAIDPRGSRAAAGQAYQISHAWQKLFESTLHLPISDRRCLAAFRSITDFNIRLSSAGDPDIFPSRASRDAAAKELWRLHDRYFAVGQFQGQKPDDLSSGKLTLSKGAEEFLLPRRGKCGQTLGGQAGNILWLLTSMGAETRGFVPYLPKRLQQIAEILGVPFLSLEARPVTWRPLSELEPGVRQPGDSRALAPSGGSFVITRKARRLILQIGGFRDIDQPASEPMPFDRVRFRDNGVPFYSDLMRAKEDRTWPAANLFCETFIDRDRTLVIDLAGNEHIVEACRGNVDTAVLGGINAIFTDSWLSRHTPLRDKVAEIAERQLRCLAGCAVQIGMELSGVPDPEFFRLLRRLCRDGVIAAVGINGEDELPDAVGAKCPQTDMWLDPAALPEFTRKTAADPKNRDRYFEYVTYRRALQFARGLGVRTLYVHTTNLDFILRRNADSGSLVHMQRADLVGKGLVIAALLQRAYGDAWFKQLPRIPPAVKPEAMVALWEFAQDFQCFHPDCIGSAEALVYDGIWMAPASDYSLAVVPVLWPPVSDIQAEKLPGKLNPTGAGDMTFGAVFFLGGL
jgi:hypothetical protein